MQPGPATSPLGQEARCGEASRVDYLSSQEGLDEEVGGHKHPAQREGIDKSFRGSFFSLSASCSATPLAFFISSSFQFACKSSGVDCALLIGGRGFCWSAEAG